MSGTAFLKTRTFQVLTINDPILIGIRPVIDQNAPANNAMFSPVMNAAFLWIRSFSLDILSLRAIVEGLGGEMRYVSEAVPLSSRLCI